MSNIPKPVLDPTATNEAKQFKYNKQMMCCRFSPCGQFVFGGAFDGSLQRWQIETDANTSLRGHNGWLWDLAFHPDGKHLYTVDTWGRLICWPYADEKPQPKWNIEQAHDSWIRSVAVSPDGKYIATGSNDMTVQVRSASDGQLIHELAGHTRHVYRVAFHPNSKSLVSGDLLGIVKHWDIATGKLVRELDANPLHSRYPSPERSLVDAGGIRSMIFSPDGNTLICGGITNLEGSIVKGLPAAIQLDWQTGKQVRILRPDNYLTEYKVHGVFIEGLAFHEKGFLIGVGGNGEREGAIWFWNLDSDFPFFQTQSLPGARDLDLHPDGLRLAVTQFEQNGRGKNGGNGRKAKMEEYLSHDGVVRIYQMAAKPEEAAKK